MTCTNCFGYRLGKHYAWTILKMNSEDLFAKTNCLIDGKRKNGKVIAIARSVNYLQICFLIENEEVGKWVPVSALIENMPSGLSSYKETKQETRKEKPNIPKIYKETEPTLIETEVSRINKEVQGNPQLVVFQRESNPLAWNNLVTWIAESACSIDFPAAEISVNRLKDRCKNETSSNIAHKLIVHKSLQAAGVELFGDIADSVNNMFNGLVEINLPSISKLSAEMVYQIAAIYGFPLTSKERQQEALMIFCITCLAEQAIEAGINWLKLNPIKDKLLKVAAKALMIYAIGNVACIYYQLKSEQKLNALTSSEVLNQLKQQTQNYLKDTKSENEICNKITKEIQTAFPKVDYTQLQALLAAKKWKEADVETGTIVLQLLSRNSVDDTKTLPKDDIRTIDKLWGNSSKGHFGFSLQKHIYQSVDSKVENFGKQVGWGEEAGLFGGVFAWKEYQKLNFNLEKSPKGHLPAFWLKIYEGQNGGVIVDRLLKPIFERKDW